MAAPHTPGQLPGQLRTTLPLVAAPMAGGPTTPDLVVAAARAGAFGFLGGGYLSADALSAQVEAVRTAGVDFGVNLFTPPVIPVDPAEFRRYAEELRQDAARHQVDLDSVPLTEDDGWRDKVDLLLSAPVPVVSFTFGMPNAAVVDALHRAGSLLVQTVTSATEAAAAAERGVDALVVQASAAGGHSGTLTPATIPPPTSLVDLLDAVRRTVDLPLLAAGGLSSADDVAAVLAAGAGAAAVGTALLLADEAGTSPTVRAALRDPARTETVVTRAFTGRPARGIRNAFIDDHEAGAPLGYPAVHHLTRPLRAAAGAAGDADRVNLWAGTGFRSTRPGPAAAILDGLAARG
jgi:nitronate monooxygenase